VNGTVDGPPWPGAVRYTLAGLYVDARTSVPETFTNCPMGTYTLSSTSGGPEMSVLGSITPAATQHLSAGGILTFTMNFIGLL